MERISIRNATWTVRLIPTVQIATVLAQLDTYPALARICQKWRLFVADSVRYRDPIRKPIDCTIDWDYFKKFFGADVLLQQNVTRADTLDVAKAIQQKDENTAQELNPQHIMANTVRDLLTTANGTILPQNVLIKFVQNAPASLRWFRSDLSEANMNMLRLERPEIQFVN